MIEVLAILGCTVICGFAGAFTAVVLWPDRSDIPIGDAFTFLAGAIGGGLVGTIVGSVLFA